MDNRLDDELYHYGVKGMRWGIRKDPQKAFTKASQKLSKIDKKKSNLQVKSSKLSYKAAKYKLKAYKSRTDQKIAKNLAKEVKLESKAAKLNMKSVKMEQKGKKWADEINKAFENIEIKDLDPQYVALGKQYGVAMYEETKKKKKEAQD